MASSAKDLQRVRDYLSANKSLNFVQRILTPDSYPRIDNEDGSYSTHLMGNAEVDGKYIVYPHIVQDPRTRKLQQLGPDEAIRHAIRTNEFMEFSSPEEADWFAQNYKKAWER